MGGDPSKVKLPVEKSMYIPIAEGRSN